MTLNTLVDDLAVLYSTDSVLTSFGTALTDTLTEPTGDGVIECARGNGCIGPNNVDLKVYTKEANDSSLLMEVWGYRLAQQYSATRRATWVAVLMSYWTLTVCSQTGVAGGVFDTSYRTVDTIALTLGNQNVTEAFMSPVATVANTSGWIRLDVGGYRKIKVLFSGSAGSGTNAVVAKS